MSKQKVTKTLKVGLYRKLLGLMVTLSYVVAGIDGGGFAIVVAIAFSLAWIIFELWLILQAVLAVQSLLLLLAQKASVKASVETHNQGNGLNIEGEKI